MRFISMRLPLGGDAQHTASVPDEQKKCRGRKGEKVSRKVDQEIWTKNFGDDADKEEETVNSRTKLSKKTATSVKFRC